MSLLTERLISVRAYKRNNKKKKRFLERATLKNHNKETFSPALYCPPAEGGLYPRGGGGL